MFVNISGFGDATGFDGTGGGLGVGDGVGTGDGVGVGVGTGVGVTTEAVPPEPLHAYSPPPMTTAPTRTNHRRMNAGSRRNAMAISISKCAFPPYAWRRSRGRPAHSPLRESKDKGFGGARSVLQRHGIVFQRDRAWFVESSPLPRSLPSLTVAAAAARPSRPRRRALLEIERPRRSHS